MLKAGAAQVTITPPVGVELAGYGFGPSVGILGDLQAQALVVQDERETLVIVTADLIGFGDKMVARLRQRIQRVWDIAADSVLLSASHTHSGPAAEPLRQWGVVDEDYLRVLEAQIEGLVGMALRSRCPARIGYGVGRVEQVAENRRVKGGPVDVAAPIVRVDDAEGEPIAILYAVGCHPVTLHSYGNLISPDYPGYAREVVEDVLGPRVVTLFMLGAAGDTNPLGYVAGKTTPQRSRQIGAMVGCEVARVALGIETSPDAALQAQAASIDLPVEPLPAAEALQATYEQFAAQAVRLRAEGRPFAEVSLAEITRDWASDALAAHRSRTTLSARPCELQGLRLGDVAILAMPLEVFTETALQIKGSSPAALTVLCSNANGGMGYLPTEEAYNTRDYTNPQGLAPKVYGIYAFSPGAEPLLRQAAGELLSRLFCL